jgi:hypothetical protein
MARRGKPTVTEYTLIDSMIDEGLSDPEIAKKIDRTIAIVKSRRAKHTPPESRQSSNEIIDRLHASSMWNQLIQQLTKDELVFFEDQWSSLINQFSIQGILATEEIAMKDLIVLDVLCNRNLIDRKRVSDGISHYSKLIKEERAKPIEERNVEDMMNWQDTVNGMRAASESLTKDYKEYVQRKGTLLKDLKGTREQRLKTIEDSKKNFFDLVKILDEPEMRQKEGDELLVLRLAVVNQRERLKNPTKYADGRYDSPLLRPEDVEKNVNTKDKEEPTD